MRASIGLITLACLFASGCKEEAIPSKQVIENIRDYYGKRIKIRAKMRSGARCRIGESSDEWVTYCKDCQYCNGPYIIDDGTASSTVTTTPLGEEPKDWPMILGGSHDYKAIRCKGPLNKVECHPFELGKEYDLTGILERHHPPRLIVDTFEAVPAG